MTGGMDAQHEAAVVAGLAAVEHQVALAWARQGGDPAVFDQVVWPRMQAGMARIMAEIAADLQRRAAPGGNDVPPHA